MSKTYLELIKLQTLEERFRYLKLKGAVGEATFGYDRYLNQIFYKSDEWKSIRNKVILRDKGCDLGILDFPIDKHIIIHHINPITKEDILNRSEKLFDLNNLICVSDRTHKAIHYGDESLLPICNFIDRKPNDQCPWK